MNDKSNEEKIVNKGIVSIELHGNIEMMAFCLVFCDGASGSWKFEPGNKSIGFDGLAGQCEQ